MLIYAHVKVHMPWARKKLNKIHLQSASLVGQHFFAKASTEFIVFAVQQAPSSQQQPARASKDPWLQGI